MFAVFDFCKQEDQSALMSNHRQEMTWIGLFCLFKSLLENIFQYKINLWTGVLYSLLVV